MTKRSERLMFRFRELLSMYGCVPTDLVNLEMAAALKDLVDEELDGNRQ